MKILVTGGAGFIGSAVIRHLVQYTPHEVVNLDKLTYAGHLASLREVEASDRYRFEQVDITDPRGVTRVLDEHRPDAVMHLAAETHVDRSIDGPDDFIQANIVGTFNLLERVRAYLATLPESKRSAFRFHHVSTDEVYGDLPHPDDRSAVSSRLPKFTEETAYAPSSPYSASKAASDHLVRAWGRTYDIPVLVTNCSNNYGPYQLPEKLIPLVILNGLEGRPLPVYGEGDQIRDWLYVEDHARGLVRVLESGRVGRTYNIGGHNERRNVEIVNRICDLLDELAPADYSRHELITHVADRPGHDRRYAIDARRMATELDWQPRETVESGLRKTVQWYLDNQHWCREVQHENDLRKRRGGTG